MRFLTWLKTMPARRLGLPLVSARLQRPCGADAVFVEDDWCVVKARGLTGEAHWALENRFAALVDQGFALGASHFVKGCIAGDDFADAGGADALAAAGRRPVEASCL